MVAHALPLFHVHGLILGILGPRPPRRHGAAPAALLVGRGRGGPRRTARPCSSACRRCTTGSADDAEDDGAVADALGRARLLVSGSAALPAVEHERIERLTGQRVVERYGMTETLMNTSIRGLRRAPPGYVGLPLEGVELRLVDDDGRTLETRDDETFGEIACAGPTSSSST